MPKAPRSAASHQSWRAQAQPGETSSGKNVQRVLLSLVALGLTGLLGWLVFRWMFLPKIYFACLPVVDHGVLEVPPIAFSLQDADRLAQWSPHLAPKDVVWRGPQTSQSITTLTERLQGIVSRDKDVLVFYVSAHGVSDNGTAYLLCGDFDPREANSGRYPLAKLLGQLEKCPGRVKLLLLDAAHLTSDPRLGMAVNEFPRLLAEEVEKIKDPNLWVLASSGPLQTSKTSYSANCSIFGFFLAEGLRGAADRDEDRMVDLAELYEFVHDHVAEWTLLDSDSVAIQTPQLFQGGVGIVEEPEAIDLLPAVRREAESAAADKPKKKDAEEGPDPRTVARAKARERLDRAWQLRDQLQMRTAEKPWSAVDYAPHLWRAHQELLLGYERRYRAGEAFDPADLIADIDTNILADKRQAAFRLMTDAEVGFQGQAENTGKIREVIQLRNDLLFRAPYYVRWHAAISQTMGAPDRLADEVAKLLTQTATFLDEVDELRQAVGKGSSLKQMQQMLDRLRSSRQLREVHQQIEDGLAADARELATRAKAKGSVGRIESLLSTPLLSAPQRMKLVAALDNVKQTPLQSDPAWEDAGYESEASGAAEARWRCLAEQATLESALIRMADPDAEVRLPKADASTADDGPWEAYREFGTALGTFYRGLPGRINEDLQSEVPSATAARAFVRAERLLRLVDARDAEQVVDDRSYAVPTIRFPVPADRHLTIAGPAEPLSVAPDAPTNFQVSISAADTSIRKVEVSLDYLSARLSVTDSEDRPIVSGRWVEVSLTAGKATVDYRASPVGQSESGVAITASVRASAEPDAPAGTCRITFHRAAPDFVDLLIHRTDGIQDIRTGTDGDERFRVRPFPNRVTTYRLDLVNRSDEDKTVEIHLLAVPEVPLGERPTLEHLLDGFGNPRSTVRRLLPQPVTMELQAGDKPRPVPFPAPEPPKAEGPPPPEGDELAPTKPAVTSGIACVIHETGSDRPPWIKWIDLPPLPPKAYLKPDVQYDPDLGKITIVIGPIQDELGEPDLAILPALAERPITIRWDTSAERGLKGVKDTADLIRADQPAQLFANVAPDPDREVWVRLTVDGYPRAFTYRVRCDPDNPTVRYERSLSEIRIIEPRDKDALKVPIQPNRPLTFRFEVDAPEDAFRVARLKERVEVQIVDEFGQRELAPELARQFPADRQIEVRLHRLAPQGLIEFDTSVEDFRLDLPDPGLRDIRVRLQAKLLLQGRPPLEQSVGVILDGSPPDFEIVGPPGPVRHGAAMSVGARLTEEDLSGVKQVTFGLCRDQAGPVEGEPKPKPGEPRPDRTFSVKLPTGDLEPGPYFLRVVATDTVGNAQARTVRVVIASDGSEGPDSTGSSEKGAIEGLITVGDQPTPNMTVTLTGENHSASAKTGDDGRYLFRNVPVGQYTIDVEGITRVGEKKGSRKVTVQSGKTAAGSFSLKW